MVPQTNYHRNDHDDVPFNTIWQSVFIATLRHNVEKMWPESRNPEPPRSPIRLASKSKRFGIAELRFGRLAHLDSKNQMQFSLETENETIPSVNPPGEDRPQRNHPTTQILVRIKEWPGNTFRLWLPEHVAPDLWSNYHQEEAAQAFGPNGNNGLIWRTTRNPTVIIEADLKSRNSSILMEVRIKNRGSDDLMNVATMNCVQLSQAPDFACDDLSRLYIRSDDQWRPLSHRKPISDYPTYYRPGYLEEGSVGIWGGKLDHLTEAVRADHPLMVCLSKDGQRSISTAADHYYFLFHNQANKQLLCIHSNPEPRPVLRPGETAIIRQTVYFNNGGLMACVTAHDADRLMIQNRFR